MPWVLFWIFPTSLFVLWAFERWDTHTTARNSRDLAPVDLDQVDQAISDIWGGQADIAFCVEHDIDLATNAPGSLPPVRPFDPDPHRLPSRHARHSTNRLHRGF